MSLTVKKRPSWFWWQMANPIVTLINVPKSIRNVLAVCVVLEDGLLLVPS
jgi:hypothetical protein